MKYGSGPRPAAHTAKRCFLNCLKASLRPSIRPPSCTASKARLKGRSCKAKTPWQWSTDRARPATHTAKRCFLNCLETSLRPSIRPPSCIASSAQRTVSQSQNTMAVKCGSAPRPAAHTAKRYFLNCLETSLRPSIRPPSCTASKAPLKGRSRRAKTQWQWSTDQARGQQPHSCTDSKAPLKGRSCRNKTPWQWSTDRARGRQPMLPNVAFWTA